MDLNYPSIFEEQQEKGSEYKDYKQFKLTFACRSALPV